MAMVEFPQILLGFPNRSNQTVKHLADGKRDGVRMHPPFRAARHQRVWE
jgi:hypothetical protein